MSDILIKGMEMPTNCCRCPVNIEVCKRGYKYLIGHPKLYDKRADDCPLIPIPEHGRLIDKDALLYDIDTNMIVREENGEMVEVLGEEKVLAHIAYAPTIIPAEEGET